MCCSGARVARNIPDYLKKASFSLCLDCVVRDFGTLQCPSQAFTTGDVQMPTSALPPAFVWPGPPDHLPRTWETLEKQFTMLREYAPELVERAVGILASNQAAISKVGKQTL